MVGEKKRPVVCMVALHGCIRVFKMGFALKQKGYTVHLVAQGEPFGHNVFDSFSKYVDADQGRKTVAFYDPHVDVFHVHNEPDWLVSMTRSATKKPVVFDIHDLECLRSDTVPDPIEEQAFQEADAFVHVSEPCRECAEKYHGNKKPAIILHSYINENFIAKDKGLPPQPCFDSLCYEGGLGATPELWFTDRRTGEDAKGSNYRYLLPIVEALRIDNYQVTLFSASPGGMESPCYHDAGAAVIDWLPYPTLLAALRPHGLGFVGACEHYPIIQACMPNKLFEYMSQGVVPVCLYASEAAKWVKDHECGIVLENTKKVREQIEAQDPEDKRRTILGLLPELTMEKHIHLLEDLYQQVL